MSKKMDLIAKLHQDFVYEKICKTNWMEGTTSPLVIELDTTEACDLACPGCISEDIMKTQNKFSNERLLSLGKEFYEVGVKAVVLIGGGEPLAHPAVGDLMEYLGKHDIHIGITTNGTFIKKYLEQIAEYSSWTRVSMDAASDELFKKLRPSKGGKSKFFDIVENMQLLAEVKKGKLGYSYLIQTGADGIGVVSNVHEIYQAAELARDIGCDYFEVKPSYQFRNGSDHALMQHDSALMSEAKQQIKHLDELETETFSILKAINLEYSLNSTKEPQYKNYHTCPATELRTLVCPSGVFVCPYWRGKEKMYIGELHNTSFEAMWQGKRRKKVMEHLNPGKHCSFHCLRHDSNLEVLKLIQSKDKQSNIQIIDEFDRFI